MPVIFLIGDAIQKMSDTNFNKYTYHLKRVVSEIKELELAPHEISCVAPKNRIPKHQNKEIIIFVEGLFKKPRRTRKVTKKISEEIVCATNSYFISADLIECFVEPFDSKLGSYSFVRKI